MHVFAVQKASILFAGRTFPGHPYFATQLGSGQLSLFNLLKAYSLLDKEVGYCQGLSFVAGILLMHVSAELTLHGKATMHQVTAMVATSKNVLFPGHNHLLALTLMT